MLQSTLIFSVWPLSLSMVISFVFLGSALLMTLSKKIYFLMMIFMMLLTMSLWVVDLLHESKFMGSFNIFMSKSFKLGMLGFIFSELMFFFTIFWAYLHSMLLLSGELGFSWPFKPFMMMEVFSMPLLNTILLLSSGVSLSVAHNMKILSSQMKNEGWSALTIAFGVIFLGVQALEFKYLTFLFSDSVYGSIFFFGTSFHGLHVVVGILMLLFCLIQNKKNFLGNSSMVELSSWYWHFVDMIWIFLFYQFYWWSN